MDAVENNGEKKDVKVYAGNLLDHLTGATTSKKALVNSVPVKDNGMFAGQTSYMGELYVRDDGRGETVRLIYPPENCTDHSVANPSSPPVKIRCARKNERRRRHSRC